MSEFNFVYKSRFQLPRAEADFVCAMAAELQLEPDAVIQFLVRYFAFDDPSFAQHIWQRAKADGRGPWK